MLRFHGQLSRILSYILTYLWFKVTYIAETSFNDIKYNMKILRPLCLYTRLMFVEVLEHCMAEAARQWTPRQVVRRL